MVWFTRRVSRRPRPVSRATFRRRRAGVVVAFAAVVTVLVIVVGGGSGKPGAAPPATTYPNSPASIPAIEAAVVPWSLDVASSRQVVLPGPASTLTVLGGLSASNLSLDRVFSLDTATGRERQLGTLAAGVHDAAGARLGSEDLLFGGGSPLTGAGTEQFPVQSGAGFVTATVPGRLPQPRSDAAGVTIGSTAYIVGGYDGTRPDPQVLSTTDGKDFSVVASLPVPVRYPAVAALGGKIYVFGGEAITGAGAGGPVDAVQVVDPLGRTATEIGPLPQPLMGAAATVVAGHLYVAGGVGATSSAPLPGVWVFDTATGKLVGAGALPSPVAYAGDAVLGARAWLVGGEVNGRAVATVEMLTPRRTTSTHRSPG
jgi:hypothetical protein